MTGSEYTKESWLKTYREFMKVMAEAGLPEEVGKMIAKHLKSEGSLRRMISYMRNARPHSIEQIADEMVAIMEDKENWIKKKQAEESNYRYNMWLNREIEDEE